MLLTANYSYCFLRVADVDGCFVKPLLFSIIIFFQRIQQFSFYTFVFVFFFAIAFQHHSNLQKAIIFSDTFVAATCSRVLKIYLKTPQKLRFEKQSSIFWGFVKYIFDTLEQLAATNVLEKIITFCRFCRP